MAQTIERNDMLDRRVRGGHNREQSDDLLSQVLRAHGGVNLVTALVHNGFATERQAYRYVEANHLD